MGLLLLAVHAVLVSIASTAPSADAWGKEGHFMVCKIAEQYLTEATSSAVAELLPEEAGGELASVCSWADEVRFRYRWSSPLHFINTPEVCTYKYSRILLQMPSESSGSSMEESRAIRLYFTHTHDPCTALVPFLHTIRLLPFSCILGNDIDASLSICGDCHNSRGEEDMCVVGAINNYTDQLRRDGDPPNGYNLTESLMFLAHFVGDVHQPLHVGFEADEGGNTIIIHWYRRKTNLHHVWDVSIIETAMKDFYNNDLNSMIEAIQMNITDGWSDEVDNWKKCENKRATCANDYALESIQLACNYAYKDVEQDSTLEDEYFFSRLPVVEKRIAQAGVRLGAILNRIFDEGLDEEIQSY